MPEDTQPAHNDTINPDDETESTTLHTCACGEQHLDSAGHHWESCTSPQKSGDTCCCGSGHAPVGNQHRCSRGPNCQ